MVVHIVLMVAGAIDVNFSCSRTTNLDTNLSCSSGPDVSMTQGCSIGHLHLFGPDCSITFGHQHGLRWFIRTWATEPLVTIEIGHQLRPCLLLGHRPKRGHWQQLRSEQNMTLDDNSGHSNQTCCGIGFGPDSGFHVAIGGNIGHAR